MSDSVSRSELFTGTVRWLEQQTFDVAGLEAYLRQHIEGFAGPLTVEQFKGGQSNPTFKLITPGKTYDALETGPCRQTATVRTRH